MLMTNFLRTRRSVREFRSKVIDEETLRHIGQILKELESEYKKYNLSFRLFEKGDLLYSKLKGTGGYSGVMIESPHYITLEYREKNEDSIIYGAYYMEKIITELNELGINTCWVSVGNVDQNVKKTVFQDNGGVVDYILAIGYEKRRNPFINETFSERIGVEELVFDGKIGQPINMDDLENRGLGDLFYYVRFAPSSHNKQPWRFLLEKDRLKLLLQHNEDGEVNLMDAGVIMYYFQVLAETIGIDSKWSLIDRSIEEVANKKYKYIGEINL